MREAWVFLLAWSSVVGDVTPPPGWESTPGYAQALRWTAEDMELVGPWEEGPLTIDRVRTLYRECDGLPRLWVLDAQMSERQLEDLLKVATDHVAWAKGMRRLASSRWEQDGWDVWIAEAEQCAEVYRALAFARFYVRIGRSLADVREQLGIASRIVGRDDLQMGLLPPPVPVWRFRRIP